MKIELNGNIELTKIKTHSPEWYEYRNSGIGSSETGSILGLTDYDYSSPMDVYARKIGSRNVVQPSNEKMFHGTFAEPWIAECWKYWDGKTNGYVENYENKNKIRDLDYYGVKDIYFRNKEYPWLFSSSDGLIMPGQHDLINGDIRDSYGVLEIKRPASRYLYSWQNQIPPYYIPQVHHEMLVLGTDYSEIAMLVDGHKLDVIPIEMSDNIKQRVLESTHHFWYDMVVPSKKILSEMEQLKNEGKHKEAEKLSADLYQYEPEVTGSEAYKLFLSTSEQQKINAESYPGTETEWLLAKKYKWIGHIVNMFNSEQTLIENKLRDLMLKNKSNKIDFEEDGYVRVYYRGKQTEKTTFDNRIKVDFEENVEDKVKSTIKKIVESVEI